MHPSDILDIYRAKELRINYELGITEKVFFSNENQYLIKKQYPAPYDDDSLADRQLHFECELCSKIQDDSRMIFDSLASIRRHYTISHNELVRIHKVRKILHHYDVR